MTNYDTDVSCAATLKVSVNQLYLLCFRNDIALNQETKCKVKSTAKVESHYMNVSILIKFSQKTSVFTLIIISSP